MSKMLRMFWSTVTVITITVTTYYTVAAFAGGLDDLIQSAFGGLVSALTVIVLVLCLGAFGIYVYWLSEHRPSTKGSSSLHAIISVAALALVGVVGVGWVQWSWALFWVIPLFSPVVVAALVTTMIARRIFRAERRVDASSSTASLDELLGG